MTKKVYAVSSGEYSDYGIEHIFSTKEKAEEFIKLQKEYGGSWASYNEVEEYDLDPEIKVPYKYHKFKFFYYLNMDKEGNTSNSYKYNMSIIAPEDAEEDLYLTESYKDDTIVLAGVVNAESMEHAVKIMNERRMKILFHNKWPDKLEEKYGNIYLNDMICSNNNNNDRTST